MAIQVTPGSGASFKTTLDGSDHVGHINVDSSPLEALIGALNSSKEVNPDAASANENALLRGILQKVIDGITTPGETTPANSLPVTLDTTMKGVAGTASANVLSVQGRAGMVPVVVDHSSTGVGHGVKTVTTAGTDEALAASTAAKWVTIQAQTDNTDKVAVGATGVDATVATGTGIVLDAGESITLPVDNLADVFIDALVNGEGVRYVYGT